MPYRPSKTVLLWLLVFAQFAGTCVWFVGNAIVDSLPAASPGSYALLTIMVQAGFIAGTMLVAVTALADRIPATTFFFFSSLAAAASNLGLLVAGELFALLPLFRFLTGFFLAGIYPVGMKIAAEIFPEKLGKALGFLVGALVLGTSFPHLVRSMGTAASWQAVVVCASVGAVVAGAIVRLLFPVQKPPIAKRPVQLSAGFRNFRDKEFRAAAFGYFGHMWELYAFWALLPILFTAYNQTGSFGLSVYGWSFGVIATGSLGCAIGGLIAQKIGSRRVAFLALVLSGACCVAAPFVFQLSEKWFLLFCLFWGFAVTADSPQFSAMVARFAEPQSKGTALALVTSIGFAITVVSIQLLKPLFARWGVFSLWILAFGPAVGLLSMTGFRNRKT